MTTKRVEALTPIYPPGLYFPDGSPVKFPVARGYGPGWVRIDWPDGYATKEGRGDDDKEGAKGKVREAVSKIIDEKGWPVISPAPPGENSLGATWTSRAGIPVRMEFVKSWRNFEGRIRLFELDQLFKFLTGRVVPMVTFKDDFTFSKMRKDPDRLLRELERKVQVDVAEMLLPAASSDMAFYATGIAKSQLDEVTFTIHEGNALEKLGKALDMLYGIEMTTTIGNGEFRRFEIQIPGTNGGHKFTLSRGSAPVIECEWENNQHTYEREMKSKIDQFLAQRNEGSE